MRKKKPTLTVNHARAEEVRAQAKAADDALQARGVAAFTDYYQDGPYARAKLAAGMRFTPELVDYLERAVSNRKIAEKIRKENEESDNGNAEAATDRAGNGSIGAGTGGGDRPADTGGAADDAGAGRDTERAQAD